VLKNRVKILDPVLLCITNFGRMLLKLLTQNLILVKGSVNSNEKFKRITYSTNS
jgi:hypothetical protein